MGDLQQWEYKTISFGPNSARESSHPSVVAQQLDQEGAQGWEMIGNDRLGADIVIYLKRPKAARTTVRSR